MPANQKPLGELLRLHEAEILDDWVSQQFAMGAVRDGKLKEAEIRQQSRDLLSAIQRASQAGFDTDAPQWGPVRDTIAGTAQAWARMGLGPSETATFVFSLKKPVFNMLGRAHADDAVTLAREVWAATLALDCLGLIAMESYQKSREEIIARQQQELLELSTPVVSLWDGVLALPLIGTLDSARTQVVMENLLQEIVRSGAGIAIIDITGVPAVDTLVAQHLLKTVAAARLMGADCIISGIRPQIAQTIVHLGVELAGVTTKATLADAFRLALQRVGMAVVRAEQPAGEKKAWSVSQS